MTGGEAPKIAIKFRTQAAAGEDFEKLPKEAFEPAAGKSATPCTANPQIRRGRLPASQVFVFDMKAGELSPVLKDPSGHYFDRLMSTTTPSLADPKEAMRDAREYFGPGAPPDQGMQGIPRSMPTNNPRPGPPAGQSQQ
jgi:hypothetical protein